MAFLALFWIIQNTKTDTTFEFLGQYSVHKHALTKAITGTFASGFVVHIKVTLSCLVKMFI
jgi:hypothetical protein